MKSMSISMRFLALLLCLVMVGQVSEGAERKKDKKKKGQPVAAVDSTKVKLKGIPAIKDFIKANAVKHAGMFNVYEQADRYFMEIPDELLGRDVFVFVSLIKGSAKAQRSNTDMMGYGGDALYSKVIRFEKGPKDRMYLHEPRFTTVMPDTANALYGAIEASDLMPIVNGLDIKAKSENSSLIDITDLYKSDHYYFSLKGAAEMLNLGAYQADQSYTTTISSYPNNIIFRSVRSYAPGKAPKVRPGMQAPKMDPTTWEMAASWYLLPEEPMRPRYFDNRVGYFAYPMMDYAKNPLKAEVIGMVSRWRLEPKPEDMKKYEAGELVEPAKPIVFYVDYNTPKYLQPYVIAAVNEWQPVFEKVGFKNAIVGKMMPRPEEDSTFSPEDARYSIISYKASPIPNAYGPHVADPRSGEIICSHVGLFHNVLSLAQTWYFAQTAGVNPLARKFPYDEELMGTLVKYIVVHEIGHTLGLRHNFAGSWVYSLDEIRDREFVKKHGHGSSVMDYMRFNYAAQPEDNIDPEDLIPRIGEYDEFAIDWGYRYFPRFKTVKEEEKYLKDWVTAQREANPRLLFGTEIDREDPRLQAEDLSDNTIQANILGIKNLKYIMKHIEEWTAAADDEDYSVLKSQYKAVVRQYGMFMMHAVKYMGGRYQDAALRSEKLYTYTPVPKETQQEAMKFLKDYYFTNQAWLFDNHVGTVTSVGGDVYKERLLQFMISSLLAQGPNFLKHEGLIGDKAYTLKNMADDLYDAVWNDLYASKSTLGTFERMKQTTYLTMMFQFLDKAPLEKHPEHIAIFVAQLDKISAQAKKKLASAGDDLTKNHLSGIVRMIDMWLKGEKDALLK